MESVIPSVRRNVASTITQEEKEIAPKSPLLGILTLASLAASGAVMRFASEEEVGERIFFDTYLSTPPGQACASCHSPETGFTGPDSEVNARGSVMPGAIHSRAGNRKPPSSAYASFSPPFQFEPARNAYLGGQFWDGRAIDIVMQAKAPFLNPLEQNNPNPKHVVAKVAQSQYAEDFREVFGPNSLDPVKDVFGSYHRITEAIAAFEGSSRSNAFTSKFDYFRAGLVTLTPQELWGRNLFNSASKGNCASCHPSQVGPYSDKPLFTDFRYANIGTPRNPENPFYGAPRSVNPLGPSWVDLGLAFTTGRPEDRGLVKTPALRNVDKRPHPGFVKAYGHNGVFKSLKEVVHFYNTRDVLPWPAPEVPETINTTHMGNLGLTDAEEDAIVAFLKTLSDGYQISP